MLTICLIPPSARFRERVSADLKGQFLAPPKPTNNRKKAKVTITKLASGTDIISLAVKSFVSSNCQCLKLLTRGLVTAEDQILQCQVVGGQSAMER